MGVKGAFERLFGRYFSEEIKILGGFCSFLLSAGFECEVGQSRRLCSLHYSKDMLRIKVIYNPGFGGLSVFLDDLSELDEEGLSPYIRELRYTRLISRTERQALNESLYGLDPLLTGKLRLAAEASIYADFIKENLEKLLSLFPVKRAIAEGLPTIVLTRSRSSFELD